MILHQLRMYLCTDTTKYMKIMINNIIRVLSALLICSGLVFAGCTDDPLGEGENTAQGGNVNNGNDDNDGPNGGEGQPDENEQSQTKGPITLTLSNVTSTTVLFEALIDVDLMEGYQEVGFLFSNSNNMDVEAENIKKVEITKEVYSSTFVDLLYNTEYYYTVYLKKNNIYQYGSIQTFKTKDIKLTIDNPTIGSTSVIFSGEVEMFDRGSNVKLGIEYGVSELDMIKKDIVPDENGEYTLQINGLLNSTEYVYRTYICQNEKYMFGECQSFVTSAMSLLLTINESSITATTAMINGHLQEFPQNEDLSLLEVGILYSTSRENIETYKGNKMIASLLEGDSTSFNLSGLKWGTSYYCRSYIKQGEIVRYGEVKNFETCSIALVLNVDESSITYTSAIINANVSGLSEEDKKQIKVGLMYSTDPDQLKVGGGTMLTTNDISESGYASLLLSNLTFATYYFCPCIIQEELYIYDDIKCFSTPDSYITETNLDVSAAYDLSLSGSANSYIISDKGLYKFKVVTGNINDPVGDVTSCSILWESFGTGETPSRNALINSFCYKDNYIVFETSKSFKEGNAVIAANDATGKILWSWHIWFTDAPQELSYSKNPSLVIMDRNLGATSATPGDVGALGLFYQWGRKDPFLGSLSINPYYITTPLDEDIMAKSTIKWPKFSYLASSEGTIEYSIANPTTFIAIERVSDWCCTNGSAARWTTSKNTKSIYDPCPAGWRVPDVEGGVWRSFSAYGTYDSINRGLSVLDKNSTPTWFPSAGGKSPSAWSSDSGWQLLTGVGENGSYWTSSTFLNPFGSLSAIFFQFSSSYISNDAGTDSMVGKSVRCIQE